MDEQLRAYRDHLVDAQREAHAAFDKTVLSLSGGALGISFAFVRDIIADKPPVNLWLLIAAWVCWGLCVTSTLVSYYTSHKGLRSAIKRVDDGTVCEKPIGRFDIVTSGLNIASGGLFVVGLILIAWFVSTNLA